MTAIDDVIADLDAAIDRLTRAIGQDDVEQRRALREALASLYELRAYREGKGADLKAYHARAGNSVAGKTTEGIVWLRGKMVHLLTKNVAPEEQCRNPSAQTFPGEHSYPGRNLIWIEAKAIAKPTGDSKIDNTERERRGLYEQWVVAQPVLEGLHAARDFLVSDTGPTP
jgi:hypothetical protein